MLTAVSFHWLFGGTSVGFVVSAVLVATTHIPRAARSTRSGLVSRSLAGMRVYLATPRLRGVLGLNLVIASVGAVVMVNTVNFVRDALGRPVADVALLLAANGAGTVIVAVLLPRALNRFSDRQVMLAGALVGIAGIGSAVARLDRAGGARRRRASRSAGVVA